jgi:lipoate-protein ligase B
MLHWEEEERIETEKKRRREKDTVVACLMRTIYTAPNKQNTLQKLQQQNNVSGREFRIANTHTKRGGKATYQCCHRKE